MSNPFHDTVYRTSWPDAQATGLTWQLYRHFWWESRDKDRAWWRCSEVQRMLVESALMRGDTAHADRYLADWKIWKESPNP